MGKQPFSEQDELHWIQNFLQQRFQEYSPTYRNGDVLTDLIPIESIDKVPIAMIAGE